jgi:hypothetical protein
MAVAVAVAVAESMVVEAAFRLPATAAKLLAKVVTAAKTPQVVSGDSLIPFISQQQVKLVELR